MPLDLSNGTCQVAHWECGDSGLGYAVFPGGVEGTLAQKSACSGDPNDVFSNCTLNSFPPPPRPRVSRTYTECTRQTPRSQPRLLPCLAVCDTGSWNCPRSDWPGFPRLSGQAGGGRGARRFGQSSRGPPSTRQACRARGLLGAEGTGRSPAWPLGDNAMLSRCLWSELIN